MPSRPQFSLRTLLFATVMICLAVGSIPPPQAGGELERQEFARVVYAFVRLALCVIFPAMLIGGAVVRHGYARTFCLGGLLPAIVPLLLASSDAFEVAYYSAGGIGAAEVLQAFGKASFALVWVLVPGIGMTCVLFHWLLKPGNRRGTQSSWNYKGSLLVLGLAAFASAAIMLKLPRTANQPALIAQAPIRLTLCLMLPALLSVGAVEGTGFFRTFCAGGLIPAVVPPLLLSSIGIWDPHRPNHWETSRIFELRHFILGMWGLAPCFGLSGVLFHWLLHRGAENKDDAQAPVEKPR